MTDIRNTPEYDEMVKTTEYAVGYNDGYSNWQFSGLLYIRPVDEWDSLGGDIVVWMQDKSGNWEGYDPVDWSTWKKAVKTGAYNDIAAYHEPVQECL